MTTLAITFSRTELAYREHDGVSVTLFWIRGTDLTAVEVVDGRNGMSFELVVEPHERPLDVFYHPYAYAAGRGVELDTDADADVHRQTVDV
jgi:hypothetical protein